MPRAVFISPHHDDVCFSLAATALACQDGQLINVFTQSKYAVIPTPFFAEKQERIKYITGLRTAEDLMFADACNLTRHDLKLEEPRLQGIHPFDLTGLQLEVEQLDSILIDQVIGLHQAQGPDKPALYCPMGIGGHRNHVSVLMAVVNALSRLRNLYDVYFYEDLHYASRVQTRNEGLLRFTAIFNGERLTRRMIAITPGLFAKKMGLVGIYFSQHGGKPPASDFIPATPGYSQPHEAVWVLSS